MKKSWFVSFLSFYSKVFQVQLKLWKEVGDVFVLVLSNWKSSVYCSKENGEKKRKIRIYNHKCLIKLEWILVFKFILFYFFWINEKSSLTSQYHLK